MNERALMAIMKWLDNYDDPLHLDWPQHELEEVIFTKWAIEEILTLVWDHPWTLASETIEAFAIKLEGYVITSEKDYQKHIFSIAAQTAWEVLEFVLEVEK